MILLSERLQGILPSNTKENPLKYFKAITLMSGKQVEMNKEAVLGKDKEPVVEVH